MLKANNIEIAFQSHVLLNQVNIEINSHELLALTGRNGTGKSTLLKVLSGFIKPKNGRIWLDEKYLNDYSIPELSSKIAFLPSKINIPQHHTAYSFISLGCSIYTKGWNILSEENTIKVEQIIHLLSLENIKHKPLFQLSDGQKQKVILAQTLVRDCTYILMDEPLTFLDYETKLEMMTIFSSLVKEKNISIIISTHDIHLLNHFNKNYHIEDKKLVLS